MNDIDGNKFSTGIFNQEEKSSIFIFNDTKIIKTIDKPNQYAWRIFDIRNKPWYYPYFLYKRKYKRYKKIFLDSKNHFLDKLKLNSGNYHILLNRGYIQKIIPLQTQNIDEKQKN